MNDCGNGYIIQSSSLATRSYAAVKDSTYEQVTRRGEDSSADRPGRGVNADPTFKAKVRRRWTCAKVMLGNSRWQTAEQYPPGLYVDCYA